MNPQQLRERTWEFSKRTRRFCVPLFRTVEYEYPARQLRRSSASTASNYRAACIARTTHNRIAKLDIVLEEADESAFWSADMLDSGLQNRELDWISNEAQELTRIFGAARRTLMNQEGGRAERDPNQ
ncbi:MAG TPA: four helix bundle protein [Vicinamibacterales bacterium]|nr:four helix bundle protein [Vicinamibacterales bacterium]